MTEQYDRRSFLKIGAAGAAAWTVGGASFAADVRIAGDGDCSRRAGGHWQPRDGAAEDPAGPGRGRGQGGLRHHPGPRRQGAGHGDRGRAAEADRLLARRDRLQAPVRDRGAGPGDQRDPALEMARADLRGGHDAGKHAATEVPAAETIEECWQLVETAEKTQKYCVDAGELLLLPRGDAGPQHAAKGPVRRASPLRGGLPALLAAPSRHAAPAPRAARSTPPTAIRRTPSARSPNGWTSTAATASTISSP